MQATGRVHVQDLITSRLEEEVIALCEVSINLQACMCILQMSLYNYNRCNKDVKKSKSTSAISLPDLNCVLAGVLQCRWVVLQYNIAKPSQAMRETVIKTVQHEELDKIKTCMQII